MDPGLVDRSILYNQEVHQSLLIWVGKYHRKLHCRRSKANLYRNSVLDACIIPYL